MITSGSDGSDFVTIAIGFSTTTIGKGFSLTSSISIFLLLLVSILAVLVFSKLAKSVVLVITSSFLRNASGLNSFLSNVSGSNLGL
ncbi:Uncharacterised protein [Chlamydia abortus]|nr:Uncharacterised protein [Chlamydia abortus]